MFNRYKQKLPVYKTETKRNELNEDVPMSPSLIGYVNIFISYNTHSYYNSNDMYIQQATHIGVADSPVDKDCMIDGKYNVIFCQKVGRNEYCLYLQEVENNGHYPR